MVLEGAAGAGALVTEAAGRSFLLNLLADEEDEATAEVEVEAEG
jgi:hypothetical protein